MKSEKKWERELKQTPQPGQTKKPLNWTTDNNCRAIHNDPLCLLLLEKQLSKIRMMSQMWLDVSLLRWSCSRVQAVCFHRIFYKTFEFQRKNRRSTIIFGNFFLDLQWQLFLSKKSRFIEIYDLNPFENFFRGKKKMKLGRVILK